MERLSLLQQRMRNRMIQFYLYEIEYILMGFDGDGAERIRDYLAYQAVWLRAKIAMVRDERTYALTIIFVRAFWSR